MEKKRIFIEGSFDALSKEVQDHYFELSRTNDVYYYNNGELVRIVDVPGKPGDPTARLILRNLSA